MSLLPREQWFDMDSFFDNFFGRKHKSEGEQFFSPRVDIIDKDDHYEIIAELPSVKKDDVSVQLHDGVLTIEARTSEETESEKDKVIRKERRSGFFSRSFTVGRNVSEQDIHAKFEDGLLKLSAPKLEQAEQHKRRINIQ